LSVFHKAFYQQLLGAIAKHSETLVNIPDADTLNQKLIELSPPADQVQDIAELRRVKSHLTRFMSRRFAGMLQTKMLESPINKRIINKFYPLMETPSFLDGLPEYGKKWDETGS
jgi:hypothetical protein